ncbi:arylsulfatase [Planctomycetota bacterium]|nr:arylsulfatase [Planctomycetota bacterium]
MKNAWQSVAAGTAMLTMSGTPCLAAERQTNPLPNVVVIFADDLGYGDLGCYGSTIPTPNIDRLAAEGMLFTDAHSAAALSAPSRFSMLTGNNPYRNGRPGGSWNINHSSGFSFNGDKKKAGKHVTAAEVLKNAGYRTAFFGKMHLGGTVFTHEGKPIRVQDDIDKMDFSKGISDGLNEHGFDYSYSLPSGIQHEPYAFFENGQYAPIGKGRVADNRSTRMYVDGKYKIGENGVSEIVEHPKKNPGRGDAMYDSSQVGIILSDKAVDFIDDHLKLNKKEGMARPFFVYYASQAIHVPHTPPIDFDGDPSSIDIPVDGVTGGYTSDMIYELDLQVGKIVKKLEDEGVADNTMIVFASDNGALWPRATEYGDKNHDNNGVLRDYKASVYEGGHRVPFIVKWASDGKSRVPVNSQCDETVIVHDWVATIYDITGQSMDEDQAMDSASLLPVFEDPKTKVHDFVIYQAGYAYDGAIRVDDWVLLVDRNNEATELYNLENDLSQKHNLIDKKEQQKRVKEMKAMFLKYNDHNDKTFHEPRTTAVVSHR